MLVLYGDFLFQWFSYLMRQSISVYCLLEDGCKVSNTKEPRINDMANSIAAVLITTETNSTEKIKKQAL